MKNYGIISKKIYQELNVAVNIEKDGDIDMLQEGVEKLENRKEKWSRVSITKDENVEGKNEEQQPQLVNPS